MMLPSKKIDTMIRVQNLDEAVCISHNANNFFIYLFIFF